MKHFYTLKKLTTVALSICLAAGMLFCSTCCKTDDEPSSTIYEYKDSSYSYTDKYYLYDDGTYKRVYSDAANNTGIVLEKGSYANSSSSVTFYVEDEAEVWRYANRYHNSLLNIYYGYFSGNYLTISYTRYEKR